MSTLTQKRAFIKANKPLVTSQSLTNAIIGKLTDDVADSLIIEIQDNPEYTDMPVAEQPTVATELVGAESTEEFGMLLNLPYAKQSKKGFVFTYGDTIVFCNDSRLFAIAHKLTVGTIIPFKAESLESMPNGGFKARINYAACDIIMSVNTAVDKFQAEIEAEIKMRCLKFGMKYPEAKAEVLAENKAQDIANYAKRMPTLAF